MEAATIVLDDFDDDMPCLARAECIRGVLGDAAADSLDVLDEGDDD
jgi:hypothetical protein